MALAQIQEIQKGNLVQQSARLGTFLLAALASLNPQSSSLNFSARGLGLMCGLELRTADGSPARSKALKVIQRMLRRGFILLPEGEHANVISFTPPLIITERQLRETAAALRQVLSEVIAP